MADRSTRLMLDALARAAAEPAGTPLFTGRAGPGLFPATAAARTIAQRCRDDGLIATREGARPGRELATITEKGLQWLAAQANPKHVLEDFLRILEEKQSQTADLINAARQMAASLQALRAAVERLATPADICVHHVTPANPGENTRTATVGPDAILKLLDEWRSASSGDCPLPELFRRLAVQQPGLTIGCFHDLLRQLHEAGKIYLHPWTGPLYELPEPPYALLAGHLVAYYASLKMTG